MLLIVARHGQLDGPLTQWAVPNHGWWDEAPSQLGGKFPGRGLPPVDPRGEVVEWSFAPGRLVDALEVWVGSGRRVVDVDQEGGVGRPRHPTQDFNVAFSEYLDSQRIRDRFAAAEGIGRGVRGGAVGGPFGGPVGLLPGRLS